MYLVFTCMSGESYAGDSGFCDSRFPLFVLELLSLLVVCLTLCLSHLAYNCHCYLLLKTGVSSSDSLLFTLLFSTRLLVYAILFFVFVWTEVVPVKVYNDGRLLDSVYHHS